MAALALEKPEIRIRVVMGGGREFVSLNQLSEGDSLSDLEELRLRLVEECEDDEISSPI